MDKAELEQIRKDAEKYLRDYPDDHRVRRQLRLLDHIDALEQKPIPECFIKLLANSKFGLEVVESIGLADKELQQIINECNAVIAAAPEPQS